MDTLVVLEDSSAQVMLKDIIFLLKSTKHDAWPNPELEFAAKYYD
jgi:hypothetical protein